MDTLVNKVLSNLIITLLVLYNIITTINKIIIIIIVWWTLFYMFIFIILYVYHVCCVYICICFNYYNKHMFCINAHNFILTFNRCSIFFFWWSTLYSWQSLCVKVLLKERFLYYNISLCSHPTQCVMLLQKQKHRNGWYASDRSVVSEQKL